jgi:predicted nucleotidyltransferase
MKRQQTLEILAKLQPELIKRFGVTRLALFGSTVRDEAKESSDIDIIVAFDGPATSEKYFGVQFLLEDELGHPVDLVSKRPCAPNCVLLLNARPLMSEREWRFYLDDMMRFAENVLAYCEGLDQAAFEPVESRSC